MSFRIFLQSLRETALSSWALGAYLVLFLAWRYYFRQRAMLRGPNVSALRETELRSSVHRSLVAASVGALLLGLLLSGLTLRRSSRLRTEGIESMKQLENETKRLIDSWLGTEGSHQPTETLKGLWITVHPVSPPYESSGIPQLVSKLHTSSFFKDCQSAKDIGAGYLVKDGAIQTVGDLYNFLNPCGEPKS